MNDSINFNLRSSMELGDRLQSFVNAVKSGEFTDKDSLEISFSRGVSEVLDLFHDVKLNNASVFLIGNGGSASIASHIANDLCNLGGVRVSTLHEPSVLTCFANDYGYDNAYGMQIARIAKPEDLLVAISSSGSSNNICNAAREMRKIGGRIFTVSGFSQDNALRAMGNINFWLNSTDYGLVETSHVFFLHYLTDIFAKERIASYDK